MEETKDNSDIAKLFTKASHHRNISVIFLTQNLFLKGKQTRTISLNSNYMAIFKNPRDKSQFSHLASQMFPGESSFLKESFTLQVHLMDILFWILNKKLLKICVFGLIF